jgi:hypothetical protein
MRRNWDREEFQDVDRTRDNSEIFRMWAEFDQRDRNSSLSPISILFQQIFAAQGIDARPRPDR